MFGEIFAMALHYSDFGWLVLLSFTKSNEQRKWLKVGYG
jgi:hypothetical protein